MAKKHSELFLFIKRGIDSAIQGIQDDSLQREYRTLDIPLLPKFSSKEIKEIRKKTCVSRKVFAAYMGVSYQTVRAWEKGHKKPSGPARRLLSLLFQNSFLFQNNGNSKANPKSKTE